MRKVNLNDIRIDGGTQNRKVIVQSRVYGMVEMMKEGDEFDLIDCNFDGVTYWLVDGFHRYHAFKLLGLKEVTIKYVPGTQAEAVIRSYGVNASHGLPRTPEEREEIVIRALNNPDLKGSSVYQIAKICRVSQSFVAGVKDPEKKKKQKEAKKKHVVKKAEELSVTSQTSSENATVGENTEKITANGQNPDEAEMQATELAMQADMDAMYKLLEADEPLKEAHDEIKRLNHLNSQLEIQLRGITNERNEAIKMIKRLQKENDKLKAKK
jgi:hypothetical protein